MANKLHNKQSEHSMRGILCGHLHIRNTLLLGALVQNSWKGFTVSSKSFTSHSRPSSVCHLMTGRGDSRVIVRPFVGCVHTDWLCLEFLSASSHSLFPPPGVTETHKQCRRSRRLSLRVCAAIGRPDALFSKVFFQTLAELPQTLIRINMQTFNTKKAN